MKSNTKEYKRTKQREYRKKVKMWVFNHYGNYDPYCVICNERDLAKLTIHHVDDNGIDERKITGMGSNFYAWLKRNNFPDNGYEIRCFSCNCGKRINPELGHPLVNIYGSLANRLSVNYYDVFLTK